jgi:glycine cleavage system H lipoate-binding protein/TusA-related sulfurtransferase
MRIDHCEFPDDLLYDRDGLVWSRLLDSGDVLVGITSIYAAVAGRVTKVTSKPLGTKWDQGSAVGFLESGKYFGPIRAPVGGVLRAINETVVMKPRTITDAPYGNGWFARLRPANFEGDRKALWAAADAKEVLSKQIAALRVRCFAAFPDHEMFEIGIECSAVLSKLNELLRGLEIGEVVHLVTDDATAPIEMVRWSDETGQPVIDERREGNLFHFLVRKAK